MSELRNEPVPLSAYDGGAKVLGAIREVLKYGGSIEKAIDAAERALSDLRPSVRSTVGPLGHSIGTRRDA